MILCFFPLIIIMFYHVIKEAKEREHIQKINEMYPNLAKPYSYDDYDWEEYFRNAKIGKYADDKNDEEYEEYEEYDDNYDYDEGDEEEEIDYELEAIWKHLDEIQAQRESKNE